MSRYARSVGSRFTVFVTVLGFFATPLFAASPAVATTTRKVVLEKAGAGYRWKLIEAPVPAVRDHQVLIRVHALGLNRGDLSMLEPDSGGGRAGRAGLVVGTDAAGEVIAIGAQVKDVRKGARVTSTYFKNWTNGPFSAERLASVYGWTADGVLADYIALDSTDV